MVRDSLSALVPSRSASGYRHILMDLRQHKPYMFLYKGYRSERHSTLVDVANAYADYLRRDAPETLAHRTRSQTAVSGMSRPALKELSSSKPKLVKTISKRQKPQICKSRRNVDRDSEWVPRRQYVKTASIVKPKPAAADSWMRNESVSFPVRECELFGARIVMRRRDKPEGAMAVVKAWSPCSNAPFTVMFDDDVIANRQREYHEDLLGKRYGDWRRVDWEDDISMTLHLRPLCPSCGHPLGEGTVAWTRCLGCGTAEPGVMSCSMGSRIRGDDPNRNGAYRTSEQFF